MRRILVISAVFTTLFLFCGRQHKHVVEQPLPFALDEDLLRIDSLMQHDADSALTLLLLRKTSEEESSSNIDNHYQSILLSEALYKTSNEQYYRNELQYAMHYFDSLYEINHADDNITMLDARSHYMNGVGFYENDSIVDACSEYLYALEILDNHFEENQLIGFKAKFMSLIYGRLSELFSDQFMPEPSIYCGKKSLYYRQIEPTSKYGISIITYKIGLQYDILNMYDSALYHYNMAMENLPDSNNLVYRDLVSSITMLTYAQKNNATESINILKQLIKETDGDDKFNRYLLLGYIYYNEKTYDSAVRYLKSAFNNSDNILIKHQSAEYLRNIYNSYENTAKANNYSAFIADHTVSKYDNMMEVSFLNDIFYDYLKRHREKQTYNNKGVVFGIILLCIIVVIIVTIARIKSKKRIMNVGIKYNQEKNKVIKLEKELEIKRSETEIKIASFMSEPVCRKINEMVCDISISARSHYSDYPKIKLDEETIVCLGEAVTKHFPNLKTRLLSYNTLLKKDDLLLCYLYLLGLNNSQIAILRQCSFSTVFRQTKKLKKSFAGCKDLPKFIKKIAVY